jgi:hypothetical protein
MSADVAKHPVAYALKSLLREGIQGDEFVVLVRALLPDDVAMADAVIFLGQHVKSDMDRMERAVEECEGRMEQMQDELDRLQEARQS